jgi:proteic killer suppression protein
MHVEIVFTSKRLRKICNDHSQAVKKWGSDNARLLRKVLDEMYDSDNLAIFLSLPRVRNSRCHPLRKDLKGKYAIDLRHPYRLIFEPANEPLPLKRDGSLDCEKVTVIRILKKEDYHGR